MKWGRGLIVYLTIVAILYGTQDLAKAGTLARTMAFYAGRGEGYVRYGTQSPQQLFGGGVAPTGGLSYAQAGVGGGAVTQPYKGTGFSTN